MRAIPLKVLLSTGVLLGIALPLHAQPPARTATPPATETPVPASHSRIGDVMGSLTQALRDAAEQQSHPGATPRASHDAPPHDTARASLPPDATAQATVP